MNTRCVRCNRQLKNPEAIKVGMGKICQARAEWDRIKQEIDEEKRMQLNDNNQETIVLKRSQQQACTNIPFYSKQQGIPLHSPTGFEWGYAGSGPAELSKNILYHITKDWKITERHYQDFKFEFISKIPEEGGNLQINEIKTWLQKRDSNYSTI